MKYIRLAVIAHALMALIVYGYAYNHAPTEMPVWGTSQTVPTGRADKVFFSLVCATFWPLYVSVKVQEQQP